jgi:hypothetical protein
MDVHNWSERNFNRPLKFFSSNASFSYRKHSCSFQLKFNIEMSQRIFNSPDQIHLSQIQYIILSRRYEGKFSVAQLKLKLANLLGERAFKRRERNISKVCHKLSSN